MSVPRRATNGTPAARRPRRLLVLIAALIVAVLVILLIARCTAKDPASAPVAAAAVPSPTTVSSVSPSPIQGTTAPTPAFPAMFGDGFWLVGKQIAPVQYVNTDTHNKECFWARVDKPTFPHPHIVEFSEHKAGRFKVTIQPSDQVFYTRDCGTWKHLD